MHQDTCQHVKQTSDLVFICLLFLFGVVLFQSAKKRDECRADLKFMESEHKTFGLAGLHTKSFLDVAWNL